MSQLNRILMVGDQLVTAKSLQSRLDLSGHPFQVLTVRSGEEAILSIRRAPFVMMVAEEHLPGMDALELFHRARRINPLIVTILVAAGLSEEIVARAAQAGVAHYWRKPASINRLTRAAFKASNLPLPEEEGVTVGGSGVPERDNISAQKRSPAPAAVQKEDRAIPPAAKQRLEQLLTDTSTAMVILGTNVGQVLSVSGERPEVDLELLAYRIAGTVSSNFQLAGLMDDTEPLAIQFLAGQSYDLYVANVGLDYFLALLSENQGRRGQIGIIWVFAQRAIKDLKALLSAEWPVTERETRPKATSAGKKISPQIAADESPPDQEITARVNSVPALPTFESAPPPEKVSGGRN